MLIGNYGVGNFGDEALRDAFLAAFPNLHWTVVTAKPVLSGRVLEVDRLPLGIRSLFRPWWRTIGSIRRADAVIFGGGTLFTDIESVLACFLWGAHALVAQLFGVPVIFAAQGVGPFKTRVGEGMTRSLFRRSVFISVRDDASFARVGSWGLNTHIVHTFDPAFLSFCREKMNIRAKKVFTVIPRHNTSATFEELYKKILSEQTFDEVRIVSLQPFETGEVSMVARLRTLTSLPVTVVPVESQLVLLQEVAKAELVLCQRFHGALAALAQGKTVRLCPLEPGDKLDALAKAIETDGAESLVRHWRESAELGEAALQQCLHRLESGK